MSVSILDRVDRQLSNNLPVVAYRKPNEKEVRVVLQNNSELHYVEDYSENGFVFAPFDSRSPAVLIKCHEIFQGDFDSGSTNVAAAVAEDSDKDLERENYLEAINKGIKAITDGKLEKVVLSRVLEVEATKKPLALFKELLHLYPTAFCYIWFHPKIGLWLGATPEIFLEMENHRFRTMSLAGTPLYKEGKTPTWGIKELEEQEMVTNFIQESLSDKVASMEVSEAKSTKAGNLWHIKSTVSGNMGKSGLSEIIRALHPTPAVCGVPKERAKEFILNHERYDRQFYTGFLGELNFKEEVQRSATRRNQENRAYRTIKKKTSLYVNLRCMQLVGGQVKIYVGGGITSRSVPENEWQETKAKSRTMLNILCR